MIDEDALRAKWGVKAEDVAEKKRIDRARESTPVPSRVTVEAVLEPLRDISSDTQPIGNRYFFVGYGSGGQWPIMNTTNEAAAKREIEHWRRLGVPVEKAKR